MKDGGMFETAFHAIYSTSEELMLWLSDFAKNITSSCTFTLARPRRKSMTARNFTEG